MSSLKDQLLKAGLVKKKNTQKAPKVKPPKQAKKNRGKPSDATLRTQRAMINKAKKDKALNQQRKIEAEKKALAAQIKQLVDGSKLDRSEGEISFNFMLHKKVKKLYVTEEQQKQLSRDQIVIVVLENERFELVPKAVASKIAERDASCVVENKVEKTVGLNEDDPYADYQIPDDLVW